MLPGPGMDRPLPGPVARSAAACVYACSHEQPALFVNGTLVVRERTWLRCDCSQPRAFFNLVLIALLHSVWGTF